MYYYKSKKELYTVYIGSEEPIVGDDTLTELTESEYQHLISEIEETQNE